MFLITATNVNGLYGAAHGVIRDWELRGERGALLHRRPSRYGDVIEFVEPVCSVYTSPWECVLLDPGRDANSWLHHMEALWCLAGRNDAAFSARYARRMLEFSDDGVTRHGAYGHRWQHHFVAPLSPTQPQPNHNGNPLDQLETCVRLLKDNPDDRRAVLTMWDPTSDLGRPGKDFPCNTQVYLKVRQGHLIATVLCRSNDLVLGAYGANAVEFAFLMAYVAARLGVPIGTMTQVSDSMHVYTAPLNGRAWADVPAPAAYPAYPGTVPLCDDPETFIGECRAFCNGADDNIQWCNSWFPLTAVPMRTAWDHWRGKSVVSAIDVAQCIQAPDWREACVAWLERRRAKGDAK